MKGPSERFDGPQVPRFLEDPPEKRGRSIDVASQPGKSTASFPGAPNPLSPPTPTDVTRSLSALLPILLIAGSAAACGDGEPRPDEVQAPAAAPDGPAGAPGPQVLDREFVFVPSQGDDRTQVAWLFRSRPGDGLVLRQWAVRVGRNGNWDALVRDEEETPFAGPAWRLLPGPRVRLVMGPRDRVEGLIVRAPGPELETHLGEFLTDWTGPRGGSVRLYRGTTAVGGGEVDGFVVDLARAWEDPGEGPGDWLFLHAGDRLQLFLMEDVSTAETDAARRFRGWSRIAFRDGQWPRVDVEWREVRAFERARRDVPVRWRLSSPGAEIVGEVETVSQYLVAGEGSGPLLPVTAFYEVRGNLRVQGEAFTVRGFVSHRQR